MILVTGGAGYLGSVLVPYLLRNYGPVRVLDNFMYGQTSLLECCADEGLEVLRGDCRDPRVLKDAMKGCSLIVPLAAIVGAPACDLDRKRAVSTNTDAIRAMLRLREKHQRVIFPCTNSGYGIGGDGVCDESSPLKPISVYGRSKVRAERMVLDCGGVSLRLATVFGASPRMRVDLLVNNFVHHAAMREPVLLFESHARRNFVHILDVAAAFALVMERFHDMQGQCYNVGDTKANMTKLALCCAIKAEAPWFTYFESQYGGDPDKRDYVISNKRIEGLGWKPRHTLGDGIRELLKAITILRPLQFTNV